MKNYIGKVFDTIPNYLSWKSAFNNVQRIRKENKQ